MPQSNRLMPGSRVATWLQRWTVVTGFARRAAALLDLAVRLWLAQIFFVSGVLKTANWDITVFLYTVEHPVPGIAPTTAALIGTAIELVCPILLALGLATRLAALPLLAATLFLQLTYRDLADHLWWTALLALFVARGAGPLSVDRLIKPHLASSAIPFAATLDRLATVVDRLVHPPVDLAVRVGVAWILWSVAFHTAGLDLRVFGALACAALALGAASRLSALALAASTLTWTVAEPALGDATLRLFILGTVVLHGPGPLSLDAVAWRWIVRLCPSLGDDTGWLAQAPRVVIVGAGFGGIAAAQALHHAWARVTLIDRHNYHLFQPLLYQVATATLTPSDIAVPIRTLLRDQSNARVVLGRVTGVDVEARTLATTAGSIPFDYLVLATGARHSYFGRDAWEAFAPGLKQIDDATAMRSRILAAFERAETCDDPDERARLLTFVLVGAGPTGVELAGAIAELARHSLRAEFRRIDPASARVVLVQSGPRVLPALPERLSVAAARALVAIGVEVLTDARVDTIDDAGVQIGDRRIEARTVLWTAGVMASPAADWIGAARDPAGRIVVAPDLSVPTLTDVFAIGDTAACRGADGRPLPGLAAVAKQQGHHVARVIRARIEGGRGPGPFRYKDLGSMATIGRKAAVAALPFVTLSGSPAWWLWGLAHVAFLVDLRSRLAVMFDWFWSYLTFNRNVRLITGTDGET